MSEINSQITSNLHHVRERIARAAEQSGRQEADIKLVAVAKYVDAPVTRTLIQAGCRDIGESRPQQLWEKTEALTDCDVRWHMIGHLQRNKVRRTLPLVEMIHSIDSQRLLSTVNQEATLRQQRVDILLEINISGEQAKHGFDPNGVSAVVERIGDFPFVELKGLMCMAALEGGVDRARQDFADMLTLRDRLRSNCPPEVKLDELSMGMSRDFEAAILEGATIVRIGSVLFEGVCALIELEQHEQGVILPVRAQPGSRRAELRGEQGGALKVAVTQVAERGKANRAVRELLVTQLRIRKSQVELISGETSPDKQFLIREIELPELKHRIEELLTNRDC